jgi:hypothetical protein
MGLLPPNVHTADITSARSWEDFLGLCLRALNADPAEHAIAAVILSSSTGEDKTISELSGLCYARVGDCGHCVRMTSYLYAAQLSVVLVYHNPTFACSAVSYSTPSLARRAAHRSVLR